MLVVPETKVCSKCGIEKSNSEFSRRLDRPIGLYASCRPCKAALRSRRYRERRKEDPVSLWVVNALNWSRDRARKRGVSHVLTREDLVGFLEDLDSCCVYCDTPFNFRRTRSDRQDAPSIDCLDPKGAYSRENTTLCCHRCNALKSDATSSELRQIADRLDALLQDRRKWVRQDPG